MDLPPSRFTKLIFRGSTPAERARLLLEHGLLSEFGKANVDAVERCIAFVLEGDTEIDGTGALPGGQATMHRVAFALLEGGFLNQAARAMIDWAESWESTEEAPAVVPQPPALQTKLRFLDVNPFGTAELASVIHRGRLFDLFAARLNGRAVCLKIPSAAKDPTGTYRSDNDSFVSSEAFVSGSTGTIPIDGSSDLGPIDALAAALLTVEAQVLQHTAAAWNHHAIGLATTLRRPEAGDRGAWPVLVMPLHSGTALDRMSALERKELVPRMLPALWDAVSAVYHGDLSEQNLVVDREAGRFHIVDPGVAICNVEEERDGEYFGRWHSWSVFTTNRANYPILAPFEPAQEQAVTLAGLLGGVASALWPRTWLVGTTTGNRVDEATGERRSPRRRPYASDLLALGMIYFRALTREEFFDPLGVALPVWQGTHPKQSGPMFRQGEVLERYARVKGLLDAGFIESRLANVPLTPTEKAVARALLTLEVEDRRQLQRLLGGA